MDKPINTVTSQDIAVLAREWSALKDRLGISSIEGGDTFLPGGWLKSQHGSQPQKSGFPARVLRRLRRLVLRAIGYSSDYDLLVGAIVGIDARLRRIESKQPTPPTQ